MKSLLVFALFGMFLLGLLSVLTVAATRNQPSDSHPAVAEQPKPKTPIQKIALDNLKWHRGGFNTVAIASFTLRNDNEFGVKDVIVGCEYHAPSGTRIGVTAAPIYRYIPAHDSITVKDFNFGQVDTQASGMACEPMKLG
jgi:hypothetical protein